jgi:hypothetical protein
VAPAPRGHAAEQGRGIVLHFVPHHLVHLLAEQDWRSSAGVRSGRHRSHVAGLQQKKSGRRGPRAARRYVCHHRHRRCGKFLDQMARCIQQASWRVEADQEQFGVFGLGLLHRVLHDFNCDGMNHAVN